MKIGEAWQKYSAQLDSLRYQKSILSQKQKELEDKPDKQGEYDTLACQLEEISKQYDAVHEFMGQLSERKMNLYNIEAAKRQSEAEKDASEEMLKCLEIYRRIASGGKVPASDEKKLMEYSSEMYMMAKNAAMMAKRSGKEYDSLWDDEEETEQEMDIDEQIDEMEL